MGGRMLSRLALLLVSMTLSAGCATAGPQSDATPAQRQAYNQAAPGALAQPEAHAPLAGTAWRLVEIVSMDDRVYAPDDRSRYTLAFDADGTVRIRADCNSATGSWTSESAGQLQFGQIAATRALCPPGSLHDRYMAQFAWIRSYVLKDGHLFLATMADGSIIEFEPLDGQ